jgi:carboxypeptidase Taq
MHEQLTELKDRLRQAADINSAINVLNWDMSTYMPPGGAAARGRQMAVLQTLAHEHQTAPEIGRLLDALQPYAEGLPYDDDDAALIRRARKEYDRFVKIPTPLMSEMSEHQAVTYSLWAEARPANDFAKVRPNLEKMLDLSRRVADCFPGYASIADPLIDFADEGMKAAEVRVIFAALREQLVPLVQAISAREPADDSPLLKHYPAAQQRAFGESVIKDYGYDFTRGRQDTTHHPFMTRFAWGDIRITTRFNEHDLGNGLFSTLHEAGHALYEMGTNPDYDGLALGSGTSAGVHESQSRTWENIVGRSRGFWEHYYPSLQAVFPEQLGRVSLDAFYRAINKVQPSLIRTEADEVTYNLHVMIRFELELDLLEGRVEVKDLPRIWKERYTRDLGITPPDDKDGVLQDVHWYGGAIGGAFQGYTLGNIMSAQFYDAALKAHPNIPDEIGHGRFGTLLGWLKDNLYIHGAKYTAPELLQRITGGGLDVAPLMRYLRGKYEALYAL